MCHDLTGKTNSAGYDTWVCRNCLTERVLIKRNRKEKNQADDSIIEAISYIMKIKGMEK